MQAAYRVHSDEHEEAAQAMCKLCEKLNDPKVEPKSLPSLESWWWEDSHCTSVVQKQFYKCSLPGDLCEYYKY